MFLLPLLYFKLLREEVCHTVPEAVFGFSLGRGFFRGARAVAARVRCGAHYVAYGHIRTVCAAGALEAVRTILHDVNHACQHGIRVGNFAEAVELIVDCTGELCHAVAKLRRAVLELCAAGLELTPIAFDTVLLEEESVSMPPSSWLVPASSVPTPVANAEVPVAS